MHFNFPVSLKAVTVTNPDGEERQVFFVLDKSGLAAIRVDYSTDELTIKYMLHKETVRKVGYPDIMDVFLNQHLQHVNILVGMRDGDK